MSLRPKKAPPQLTDPPNDVGTKMFKDMSFAARTCEPTGMPLGKRPRPIDYTEVPPEHEEKWLERMFFVELSETLDGIIMDSMPGMTEAVDGDWKAEGFKPDDYGFPETKVDGRMERAIEEFNRVVDDTDNELNWTLRGDKDDKVSRRLKRRVELLVNQGVWTMKKIDKALALFKKRSKIILDSSDSGDADSDADSGSNSDSNSDSDSGDSDSD